MNTVWELPAKGGGLTDSFFSSSWPPFCVVADWTYQSSPAVRALKLVNRGYRKPALFEETPIFGGLLEEAKVATKEPNLGKVHESIDQHDRSGAPA